MAYGKMSKGKTGMKKSGGLTKKQKTLPPALQKKIMASKKKK
jgi:hypothetical protein|tara:strand:+ start:248 stop:373 length:126 start_codon:yes stop_codon:yes gene_type:complete